MKQIFTQQNDNVVSHVSHAANSNAFNSNIAPFKIKQIFTQQNDNVVSYVSLGQVRTLFVRMQP